MFKAELWSSNASLGVSGSRAGWLGDPNKPKDKEWAFLQNVQNCGTCDHHSWNIQGMRKIILSNEPCLSV